MDNFSPSSAHTSVPADIMLEKVFGAARYALKLQTPGVDQKK